MKPKASTVLLLIAAVYIGSFAIIRSVRSIEIDSCLDSGGAWNYMKSECVKAPIKGQIVFQFEIHPKLQASACSSLPTVEALSEESEFPKLLKKGWVRLLNADYQADRKFYPCLQNVVVTFPNADEFYAFLRQAGPSTQYPFYSAADLNLMTAIFEHVARSGDPKAYNLLLLKDTRNSVSEMDAPLYATLRKNPPAYILAFDKLSLEQKKVAVGAQYDLNEPIAAQLFNVKDLDAVDASLGKAAEQFNDLMKAEVGR